MGNPANHCAENAYYCFHREMRASRREPRVITNIDACIESAKA
jgi:hypothetical protein